MTDKKQIIIDGVNVSKCDFYDRDKKYCLTLKMYPKGFKNPSCFSGDFQQCIQDSKTCPNTFCHNNPNCYYKQLVRKTQECEGLKRQHQSDKGLITSAGKMNYQLLQEYDKLKSCLTEIKEIASKVLLNTHDLEQFKDADALFGALLEIHKKISECEVEK